MKYEFFFLQYSYEFYTIHYEYTLLFVSVFYIVYVFKIYSFLEKGIISITPQCCPFSGLWNVENLTGYERNPIPMQKKFPA